MTRPLQVGIPDLVSNSYFPVIAAVELGFMEEEGVDAELELLFPVTDAAFALQSGKLDFLGGAAHAPLYAFPGWHGVKLVAALSQHMYWFLVARSDLGIQRGDLAALRGLTIGAAPGVGVGLAQLLVRSGVDIEEAEIRIIPVPGASGASISFGVTAAEALADGRVDAFWANGMGTEVAVRNGVGSVVIDARRDQTPGTLLTFPALSTTEALIERDPETVAGAVRAVVRAQKALREDPELATSVGAKLFPSMEAGLIAELIARDAPYYQASISPEAVAGVNDFAAQIGLQGSQQGYEQTVAVRFSPLWDGDPGIAR